MRLATKRKEIHDTYQSPHSSKVADDCGFLKGEATEVFEKLLDIMKKRLAAGESVMISGFGKWNVISKHARKGRNPETGDQIVINARKILTRKYSPLLKAAVNGDVEGLKR
jgi:integration host factor subunit alpha